MPYVLSGVIHPSSLTFVLYTPDIDNVIRQILFLDLHLASNLNTIYCCVTLNRYLR